MNSKFLKVAGVNSMDEFYTQYPDEETFIAKCGAKIKKAYKGVKIPKDKAEYGKFFEALFADAPTAQTGTSLWGLDGTFQQPNTGIQVSSNNPSGGQTFMDNLTGGQGFVGGLMNLTGGNPLQKGFDIINGIKAQKQKVKQAEQNKLVMGWMEDAKSSNDLDEQFNLQQSRIDSYVRPEDNVVTGEELFPIYGKGTNVLAKDGKKLYAQTGTFLGSTGQQWGQLGQQMLGSGVNELTKSLNLAPDDMGGQIGSDVLGFVGSATGIPGLKQVGQIAGKFIGDALDRSDTKIKRYNKAATRSINNMIGLDMGKITRNRFGGNLEDGGIIPNYYSGGEVKTYGEGGITPISYNPYGSPMGMIEGPSHEEGGVDMSIFGQPIEAEGGEPIMKMQDGGSIDDSMVIMGNLDVPSHVKKSAEKFLGKKLKGSKYKNVTKNIGELENNITHKISKFQDSANPNPLRMLDLIENNTKRHLNEVYDNKLKKLQIIKEGLASAQEAQNIEEQKAKYGKKVYAQDGTTQPLTREEILAQMALMAENPLGINNSSVNTPFDISLMGQIELDPVELSGPGKAKTNYPPGNPSARYAIPGTNEYTPIVSTQSSRTNPSSKYTSTTTKSTTKVPSTRSSNVSYTERPDQRPIGEDDTNATAIKITGRTQSTKNNNLFGNATINDLRNLEMMAQDQPWWGKQSDFTDPAQLKEFQREFNKNNPGATQLIIDGKFGNQMASVRFAPKLALERKGLDITGIQAGPLDLKELPGNRTQFNTEREKLKGINWLDSLNLMGTDAEDFNNAQLLPEVWAMANNKLEPVQAQKFQPRLRTPFDISFQDQLNENTASARIAERMAANNPGVLANLKAQEYMADSKVLGEQFRQNQAFKDQIYSNNLAILNDADLKNLAIADKQYERQEQARANTRATDFEAIKSMTDKRLKHNLENQMLRVWENMYNYRFDPAGRAQYRGPNANFEDWTPISSGSETVDTKTYDYLYDADGNPVQKRIKQQGVPTKKTIYEKQEAARKAAGGTEPFVIPIKSANGSIVKNLKKYK